jgi:hypothetical protein
VADDVVNASLDFKQVLAINQQSCWQSTSMMREATLTFSEGANEEKDNRCRPPVRDVAIIACIFSFFIPCSSKRRWIRSLMTEYPDSHVGNRHRNGSWITRHASACRVHTLKKGRVHDEL